MTFDAENETERMLREVYRLRKFSEKEGITEQTEVWLDLIETAIHGLRLPVKKKVNITLVKNNIKKR